MIILQLVVLVGGLYYLGLILFRIKLSADSLKAQRARLISNIEEIRNAEYEAPIAAETTSGGELGEILRKRLETSKAKAKKAEETKRRLIKHLDSMQLDERQ